jgi:hypothetical protein
MKFLVLASGTESGSAPDFGLVEAGHQVVRCHDEGAPAFPCRGMESGDCPLDVGDVDAALLVGGGGDPATDDRAGEDGARCALRRHIPLVVIGLADGSSLKPWASAVLPGSDNVTATLEIAAQAPSAPHGSVATGAFAGVLEAHGLDGEVAEAVVFRVGGSLHVELRPTGPVDAVIFEIAAIRVAGALRAFDPYPRVIDVVSITA